MDATGHLVVLRGGATLRALALPGRPSTIGRVPDNWLVLPDSGVARYQAELEPLGPDVLLTNLGGAEQVALNGRRLLPHQPARLSDNDAIAIGPFQLAYGARPLASEPASQGVIAPTPGKIVESEQTAAEATAVLPRLPDGPSRYLYELPPVYHDDDGFLGRYLKLFEAVWEPIEHRQDRIDMYFDLRTCPPALVAWLASWLGASLDPQLTEARQRRLAAEALDLYRWRGTRYGLTRALEICVGQTPQIVRDAREPLAIVIHMPAPPASDAQRDLALRLAQASCPAHIASRFEGEGWSS